MDTPQRKGPGIFLAQMMGDNAPFNTLKDVCTWAASLGYTCVQLPSWDPRVIDLEKAGESKDYCDDLLGRVKSFGLVDGITEIATHLQGQLMAVHPAYQELFAGFGPERLRGNARATTEWAQRQLQLAIKASAHLGLSTVPSFTGGLCVPYYYPWPQRPPGLVEEGFKELAARWKPVLDIAADHNQRMGYELHNGEDVHDGPSFEMFYGACGNHPGIGIIYDPSHFVLQGMDYVGFVDVYGQFIGAYHVKDAELTFDPRTGALGGFQSWKNRASRFRSLGDGQVDFKEIEVAMQRKGLDLAHVLEWECTIKGKEQGAEEGAPFINALLNGTDLPAKTEARPHHDTFDNFAEAKIDGELIKRLLGLA